MPDYRYLIVGGGLTADAACKGIRSVDADGSIGLIGDEPDPPYAAPAALEGAVARKGRELDLARDRRAGRRPASRPRGGRTRPRRPNGDRRPWRDARLREAACSPRAGARARSRMLRTGVVYYRTVADYRAVRDGREGGNVGRGRRRRVHRLRARCVARGERLCRDHGLSGRCDRRADLPLGTSRCS